MDFLESKGENRSLIHFGSHVLSKAYGARDYVFVSKHLVVSNVPPHRFTLHTFEKMAPKRFECHLPAEVGSGNIRVEMSHTAAYQTTRNSNFFTTPTQK